MKKLIVTADSWLKNGYHDAARRLYQEAIELAREFKSHHLGKVALKRLRQAELKQPREGEPEPARAREPRQRLLARPPTVRSSD